MMKWRVSARRDGMDEVTPFYTLEEAATFAELIKNDVDVVAVERVEKYTNIRIVEYIDGEVQ